MSRWTVLLRCLPCTFRVRMCDSPGTRSCTCDDAFRVGAGPGVGYGVDGSTCPCLADGGTVEEGGPGSHRLHPGGPFLRMGEADVLFPHPWRRESLVFHVLHRWVRALRMGSVLHGSSPVFGWISRFRFSSPAMVPTLPRRTDGDTIHGWDHRSFFPSFLHPPPQHLFCHSYLSVYLSRFPTMEKGHVWDSPPSNPMVSLLSVSLSLSLAVAVGGGGKGVFPIRWMGRSFVDHNRTQTRSTIPTCAPTTRLQHQRKKTQRTTPVDVDTVRSETKGKTKQTRGRKTRI